MREVAVVPLTSDPLLRLEFVKPLVEVFESNDVKVSVVEKELIPKLRVPFVLSGTALADFSYLEDEDLIENVRNVSVPVIGVCAGSQIIALSLGGKLIDNLMIGTFPVRGTGLFKKITTAYNVHAKGVEVNANILAKTSTKIVAFEKNNKTGVLFHPEVRNESVLLDWLKTA